MSGLGKIDSIKLERLLNGIKPESLLFILNNPEELKKMTHGALADKGWSSTGAYIGEQAALEEFYEEWVGK